MVGQHVLSLGERIVADPQLVAGVVADEDEMSHHAVVAHQPRHDRHPEDDRAEQGWHDVWLAPAMQLIGEPASGEGKKRQRGGIS